MYAYHVWWWSLKFVFFYYVDSILFFEFGLAFGFGNRAKRGGSAPARTSEAFLPQREKLVMGGAT